MTTTNDWMQKMQDLIKNATPGPWSSYEGIIKQGGPLCSDYKAWEEQFTVCDVADRLGNGMTSPKVNADTHFISAANPETMEWLIDLFGQMAHFLPVDDALMFFEVLKKGPPAREKQEK